MVKSNLSTLSQLSILVITFYSAQVTAIRRSLSTCGLDTSKIRISSIDACQGSEADVVLLSFVRCNTGRRIGFVRDFQRLNVALTRAKYATVAVGCANTLESSGSEDLRALLSTTRSRGCLLPSNTIS